MSVERGNKDDWNLLHDLHYKAETLWIGPKIWRCLLDEEVIGVGVFTLPKMLLAGRNQAMPKMKPNQTGMDSRLMNRHRAIWLNANTATNSRLVLDTMYRGGGVAYRMQNLMMRMTGLAVIEFQSSMSKFNPFAQKAGIKFVAPKRAQFYDQGIAFFRKWFEANPSDHAAIMEEYELMPAGIKKKFDLELRSFYYKHSAQEKTGSNAEGGEARVAAMETAAVLKSAQQMTLASPLYGIYQNPDHDRELPARIPLLAFDNQAADQPLDLTKI